MSGAIAFIGMAGCGKTTIGRRVAKLLGRPFVDVDSLIEERFGPIPELFRHGEAFFREHEAEALKEACAVPGAVIATGGGIVTQPGCMAQLKAAGAVVFIDRPIHKIVMDIDISTRPLYVCGIEALNTAYVNRLPLYRKYADVTVPNDGSVDDVCRKVSELYGEGKL